MTNVGRPGVWALSGVPAPRVHPTAWIAPGATVCGDVEIGKQCTVWFGAVLRAEAGSIKIGARSNVQDNVVVHTDANCHTVVGEDVTLGHSAIIHGCKVADKCIVGMGSILLDRCSIGSGSMVGAGSLVTIGKEFPAGSMIMGRPAKVVRAMGDEMNVLAKGSADVYVHEGELYRESGVVAKL